MSARRYNGNCRKGSHYSVRQLAGTRQTSPDLSDTFIRRSHVNARFRSAVEKTLRLESQLHERLSLVARVSRNVRSGSALTQLSRARTCATSRRRNSKGKMGRAECAVVARLPAIRGENRVIHLAYIYMNREGVEDWGQARTGG